MGEQNCPKNNIMIFMSQSVSSKGLPHRVAYTCPCMALTEIHDSEIHWISTWDIANDIHDPIMIFMSYLTSVQTHKGYMDALG